MNVDDEKGNRNNAEDVNVKEHNADLSNNSATSEQLKHTKLDDNGTAAAAAAGRHHQHQQLPKPGGDT